MVDWRARISSDPAVCHGEPCVRGTRVMVSVIFDTLADGDTPDAVAAGYRITPADVEAALRFAAEFNRSDA
jgi:uncharacterized protein (DUF433 family)